MIFKYFYLWLVLLLYLHLLDKYEGNILSISIVILLGKKLWNLKPFVKKGGQNGSQSNPGSLSISTTDMWAGQPFAVGLPVQLSTLTASWASASGVPAAPLPRAVTIEASDITQCLQGREITVREPRVYPNISLPWNLWPSCSRNPITGSQGNTPGKSCPSHQNNAPTH